MRAKLFYSLEAKEAMSQVKADAKGKCERCHADHAPEKGFTLTVHHLNPDINQNKKWNLAALCQRCHLMFQHHNPFFTWLLDYPEYYLSHCEDWFRKHLEQYFQDST